MHESIKDFHWGMLPLSRREIVGFLDSLKTDSQSGLVHLSTNESRLLEKYRREFIYDSPEFSPATSAFLPDFAFSSVLDDEKQKYLYRYTDSTTLFLIDGFGSYSYRGGQGDSVGSHFATLGELGFRIRGSLYNRLGYYMQASNGVLFSGSRDFAVLDPRLKANKKFNTSEATYFDFTTGYLRYASDWFAVTAGREQVLWGMGYADRSVFSDNTVPFNYAKIDIKSKTLQYSFLHGSLVGADTNGRTLSSKYIAAHRLEFSIGSRFRLGFSEMVLYSNQPMNFGLLNPFVFLTSAELSTELPEGGDNFHNTLMVLDAELSPIRNYRIFGSILIDDLDFKEVGKSNINANNNKFGWHTGVTICDPFMLSNTTLIIEYTRINPFVMAHWTNVNSYTHWNFSLGSSVQPNSDEWLFGIDYYLTHRLFLNGRIKIQRAGENILDSQGRVIYEAGGNILSGTNYRQHPNTFLQGNRVNRSIISLQLVWQFLWQYYVELNYFLRSFNYTSENRRLSDSIVWTTLRLDY